MASFSNIGAICKVTSPISLSSRAPFPTFRSYTHSQISSSQFGIRSSYAEAVRENTNSGEIDVEADVKSERIVVIGGNDFIGSAICKATVSKGIEVISLSRSGRTSYTGSWVDQVTWMTGDVFYANWDELVVGVTTIVSTFGGLGSDEQMQRINGEANVLAVNAAKNYDQ